MSIGRYVQLTGKEFEIETEIWMGK
jgi:hypothetical protein